MVHLSPDINRSGTLWPPLHRSAQDFPPFIPQELHHRQHGKLATRIMHAAHNHHPRRNQIAHSRMQVQQQEGDAFPVHQRSGTRRTWQTAHCKMEGPAWEQRHEACSPPRSTQDTPQTAMKLTSMTRAGSLTSTFRSIGQLSVGAFASSRRLLACVSLPPPW